MTRLQRWGANVKATIFTAGVAAIVAFLLLLGWVAALAFRVLEVVVVLVVAGSILWAAYVWIY